MDLDIRKYVRQNFKNSNIEQIKESIITGIDSKEEVVLPGLGVFLELLWNNSNDNDRKHILETIQKAL